MKINLANRAVSIEGCVKTQKSRVFGGRFGIAEGSIVEYRAI
jgi:hypothetical protein